MSRNIQVSLPSKHTDRLIPKIEQLDGLIGLRVHRDISIKPRGDVLDFDILNSEVNSFLSILEQEGLLRHENISVTTNRPTNVISKSHSEQLLFETHESSWEDMLKNLLHQSHMNLNTTLTMFFAGVVSAIGISSDAVHIVVGAMLIAPGFEPISRLVLGLVTRHRDWKIGGMDVLKGYFILIAGGVVGALIVQLVGKDALPGVGSYLPTGVLVEYWSRFSASSIAVSIVASLAGGIIIMSNKSLLTAGVMVALALIPSGALVGMGLVEGKFELAGTAFLRLLLEIFIVALFSGSIFLWKRFSTHKRDMRL